MSAVVAGDVSGDRATPAERGGGRTLLRHELKPHARLLSFGLLLVIVSGVATAVTPTIVRIAIDDGASAGDLGVVRAAAGAFVAVAVVGALAAGLRTMVLTTIAQRALHAIRTRAVGGLMEMPLGHFETLRRGDLIARLTRDIDKVGDVVAFTLPYAIGGLVSAIAAFVGLAVLAPQLFLLSLLAVPPITVAGRWMTRRSRIVYPREAAEAGAMTGELAETLEGSATIRALGAQRIRRARFRTSADRAVAASLAGMRMRNRFFATITMIQSTVTAIVITVAGSLALDGRLTVGTVSAGVLALTNVYGPISELIEVLDNLQSASAALDRVAALTVDTPDPPDTGAESNEVSRVAASGLVMTGVSFSYRAGHPVLTDVDLHVTHGERVALVGATGAGKSTIARLVVGLAQPTSGSVTIDGVTPGGLSNLRRAEHVVLAVQDGFLIDGTIADNIRLARPGVSDAEIDVAVDGLGLRSWIDGLAHGLASDVGDAGGSLSGGERQLVSLLRLAVLDPAVLVLDEATSILDDRTERQVTQALDRLGADRAVLVIAHRTATAARCDRVVVIDHGRIVADAPADQIGGHAAWQTLIAKSLPNV